SPFYFFYGPLHHTALHSFPTRRSSDLIAQVDAALGPLLDDLSRLPGPLLVALTSDHGESLGEHGYYFAHGEYLYDATLRVPLLLDRKSTRLNSSHVAISYAVFCLKKKK